MKGAARQSHEMTERWKYKLILAISVQMTLKNVNNIEMINGLKTGRVKILSQIIKSEPNVKLNKDFWTKLWHLQLYKTLIHREDKSTYCCH